MTLTRGISLPTSTAVGGGILAQARPLPDGWTRGVSFATEVCLAAGSHQFCPTSPGEKTLQGADLAEFDPFGVEASVVCTTLTSVETRLGGARSILNVVAEHNVGVELATGVITGNPSLADATPVGAGGAGGSAAEALATLEEAIADTLMGHLAWVHASPQDLTRLAAAQAIHLDDMGAWRTATGHLVVASPGYATPLDGLLVATPEVFAELGDVEQVRTIDRADNRHIAVHEAPAIAVFDPCFNVSVTTPTSP